MTVWINPAIVEKQLTGFKVLATPLSRIYTRIDIKAVFRGNTWLHASTEAFAAGDFHHLVRRPGKKPGMAVEHAADTLASAHSGHHDFDSLAVAR